MKPIFIATLIFSCLLCYGQDKLQTGLIIGYNSSTFIGKDKPGKKIKPIPGFYLGGNALYPLNKRLSLSSGLALTSKGTIINTLSDIDEYLIYLYLDMPIMLKMNFFSGKMLSPYFNLGGCADYRILAISANGGPLYDIHKIDLCAVTAAGVDISRLSFEIRYNCGITKFDNSEFHTDLRHSTLSVLVAFRFTNK